MAGERGVDAFLERAENLTVRLIHPPSPSSSASVAICDICYVRATRHELVQTGLNNTPRVIAYWHTIRGYNMPRWRSRGWRRAQQKKGENANSLCYSIIVAFFRHADCSLINSDCPANRYLILFQRSSHTNHFWNRTISSLTSQIPLFY